MRSNHALRCGYSDNEETPAQLCIRTQGQSEMSTKEYLPFPLPTRYSRAWPFPASSADLPSESHSKPFSRFPERRSSRTL